MDFFQKYTIQVENWPPYSPDLNPMEPLWVEFMYRLHRKYPDIRNPKRGLHKVEARLAEVPAWQLQGGTRGILSETVDMHTQQGGFYNWG